jgi:hypothetical protein
VKKLLILVAVVAVGFVAYHFLLKESPAHEAYEAFADNAVRSRLTEALSYAEGPGVEQYLQTKMFQPTFTSNFMESIHGTRYDVESEVKSSEAVDLVVLQTVGFDPPGTHSGMGGSWMAQYRHKVKVAETNGEWKVVSFQSEHVKTQEVR